MGNVDNNDDAQLRMEELSTGREEVPPVEAQGEAGAARCQSPVRLRTPERRQMAMVPRCPDDLVSAQHPVRQIAAVVEHLDVAAFCQPIKARDGCSGGLRPPPSIGDRRYNLCRCV